MTLDVPDEVADTAAAAAEESETIPFTDADGAALREAYAAFDAGDRGKSAAESFARVAARLGLKNIPFSFCRFAS